MAVRLAPARAALAVVVLALLGCNGSAVDSSRGAPSWVVTVAPDAGGPISSASWGAAGTVFASVERTTQPRMSQLQIIQLDLARGGPRPIESSLDDERCGRVDEYSPGSSPSAAYWLRACYMKGQASISYDVVRFASEDAAPRSLVAFESNLHISSLAIGGDGLPGVAFVGSRICDTLVEVTEAGLSPIPAIVEGEKGSFRLDDPAIIEDCQGVGRAGYPAVSPTGQIAFLASTGAMGVEGPERLGAPMELYVMARPAYVPERHPMSVTNPGGLAWSPDGRSIVVSGTDGSGSTGTWLYDVGSRSASKLSGQSLRWPSWSPDGTGILGTRDIGGGIERKTAIVLLTRK